MANIWMDFRSYCCFRCCSSYTVCHSTGKVIRCAAERCCLAPSYPVFCGDKRLKRRGLLPCDITFDFATGRWQASCALNQYRFLWTGALSIRVTTGSDRVLDDRFPGMVSGEKHAGNEGFILGMVHSLLAGCRGLFLLCDCPATGTIVSMSLILFHITRSDENEPKGPHVDPPAIPGNI